MAVIRCFVNSGNEEVNELIKGITKENGIKTIREQLFKREDDLLRVFDRHIEVLDELEHIVKSSAEVGLPIQNLDWVKVGEIKYQLISKSFEIENKDFVIKYGFIKF